MKKINGFDVDGVINIPDGGVYPGPRDVIITGRCREESLRTKELLNSKGIDNQVFLSSSDINNKTDITSGNHKADTILYLKTIGFEVMNFFEDNVNQATIIKTKCPWVNVIILTHDLVDSTDDTNYI